MPSQGEEDWSPRFNVAPTQPIPFIRQHPKEPVRELSLMRWASAAAFKCVRMHRNPRLMMIRTTDSLTEIQNTLRTGCAVRLE